MVLRTHPFHVKGSSRLWQYHFLKLKCFPGGNEIFHLVPYLDWECTVLCLSSGYLDRRFRGRNKSEWHFCTTTLLVFHWLQMRKTVKLRNVEGSELNSSHKFKKCFTGKWKHSSLNDLVDQGFSALLGPCTPFAFSSTLSTPRIDLDGQLYIAAYPLSQYLF